MVDGSLAVIEIVGSSRKRWGGKFVPGRMEVTLVELAESGAGEAMRKESQMQVMTCQKKTNELIEASIENEC